MRRKHAAEVGFSLEEDIRSLVLPFVHFVIYLVHYHTFVPSPYSAAKLLSHLFIVIFLFSYTFFLYSCSYNKSSLSSGKPEVQSTASFQPVVE